MNTITPPKSKRVWLAPVFGMDAETRSAVANLEQLGRSGRVAVAGRFMPDAQVSDRLVAKGITEDVEEEDFFRYSQVVIPFSGVSPLRRKAWEQAGVPLTDLTSPQVRRAQVALGLLRLDGAQPLVIGRHADSESKALAEGNPGTRILEDTTDTARLAFAPAFGVVCQTTLSPRRVSWLVQQLRLRYNDASVTFLDTLSPAMSARSQSLEKLMADCDRVVIVGEAGEASCEALAETALRKGLPSVVAGSIADLGSEDLSGRIALTAGAFTLDSTIRQIADALAGG